jgi:hypothetical protein
MAKPSDSSLQEKTIRKGYRVDWKRDLVRAAAVLLLATLIVVVGNYYNQQRRLNKAVDLYNKNLDKIDASKFALPVNKGEVLSIGNWEWTLIDAKDVGKTLIGKGGESGQCLAGDGYKFTQVRLHVKNDEKSSGPLNGIELFDGNKVSYKAYTPADSCIENGIPTDEIYRDDNAIRLKSGLQKTYTAYYKVSDRAGNFKVKVMEYSDIPVQDFAYIFLGF